MITIVRTAIAAVVLVAVGQVVSVARLGAAEAKAPSPINAIFAVTDVDQSSTIRLAQYSSPPNWRYRWQNGNWWYWLPSNQWAFWNGATWIVYTPDTYAGYYATRYPQYRTSYYSPGYTTGYYAPRYYYGGYYPRSYGWYGNYWGYPRAYGGGYYARRGYYRRW